MLCAIVSMEAQEDMCQQCCVGALGHRSYKVFGWQTLAKDGAWAGARAGAGGAAEAGAGGAAGAGGVHQTDVR